MVNHNLMVDSIGTINLNSNVVMHYSISLADGTPVESTFDDGEPVAFNMGDGTLPEGLELAIVGLKKGDKQSLRIGPENAFGYSDSGNIFEMQRKEFASELNIKPGAIVDFESPSGQDFQGTIVEMSEDSVKVDFSHPLADREIIFNVEIINVS